MPPKTVTQRVAAYRARKAAALQSEVRGIFAHPDDHRAIKNHAQKLAEQRKSPR